MENKVQQDSMMNESAGRRLMNLRQFILIVLLAFSLPALAYVSDEDWELHSKKNKEIQVYTKAVEGQPIRAIKAVTNLDVSIETLLTVLSDAELVPEWIPVIGTAVLLQDTDPDGVSMMYMVTRFPWPVRSRDVVVKTIIEYDKSSNTVYMESSDIAGVMDKTRKKIRIPATFTRWKISPLDSGELHVELTTHSDPGGWFPKWLVNMIMKSTPKQMFAKLQTIVAEEQERDRPFDEVFVFGKKGVWDSETWDRGLSP